MRIVFVGASTLTTTTTRLLLNAGHDVVIIDSNRGFLDELAETLDCGFIHGDGTRPSVLREAAPEQTDVLFCLTNNDQANIIASLVGRSLGFPKVVTKVSVEDFEHICMELGLEHTIIPDRTIGHYLMDMLMDVNVLETSAMIKDDGRLFSFVAREEDAKSIEEQNLPKGAQVICFYRDGKFKLADPDTGIKKGDEVVILTQKANMSELRKRWTPANDNNNKLTV